MYEELDAIKLILEKRRGGGRKIAFKSLLEANTPSQLHDFHQKCDNMGPTLTVLYGCQNVLFGGYTSKNWVSTQSRTPVDDREAFLFVKPQSSSSGCEILPYESGYGAITCHADYGPTFGGGYFFWQDYDLQAFVINRRNESKKQGDVLTLNGTLNFNCAYKTKNENFRNVFVNGGTLHVYRVAVYQVLEYFWRPKPERTEIARKKDYLCNFDTQRTQKVPFYNILLLGLINAGKSSLFNTFASAVSGRLRTVSGTGEDSNHSITKKLHGYELLQSRGEDIHIKVFDIRGITADTDLRHELEHILDGRIPVGYVFPDTSREVPAEQLVKEGSIKNNIHLVVVVCDVMMWRLDSIQRARLNALRSRIDFIREKDLPICVVATKWDTLPEGLKCDAETIYQNKEVVDAINYLAQITTVTKDNIFPVINYTEDAAVSEAKNSLAIQALYSMIKQVEDYLEHHPEKLILRNTWECKFGQLPDDRDARFELRIPDLQGKQIRALCLGPLGSGKSSFIDSLASLLSGTMSHGAAGEILRRETGTTSHTTKFTLYPLEIVLQNQRQDIPFLLGDMPGLQISGGVTVGDIKMVMDGHVPNLSEIQRGSYRRMEEFNPITSITNKIHCVCFVFDITTIESLHDSVKKTIDELVQWIAGREIPFIVVLTKSDALSEAVYHSTMDLFLDRRVRYKKEKLQEMFGFREERIFPVRNYTGERYFKQDMDRLLLDAFQEILQMGSRRLLADQPDEPNRGSCAHDRTIYNRV